MAVTYTYTNYPPPSGTTPPPIGQLDGSTEQWIDDIVADRSVAGTIKVRALFSAKKKRFAVNHMMTAQQFENYQDFYNRLRLTFFSFIWAGDGLTYTVCFEKAPQVRHANTRVEVQATLVQQ